MSWALAFLGFAMLVILHEAGHFFAAKAVGMRVERFALFFPPLLYKIKRGETEYGIGAIPLGGYVRITGMNPRKVERFLSGEEADIPHSVMLICSLLTLPGAKDMASTVTNAVIKFQGEDPADV